MRLTKLVIALLAFAVEAFASATASTFVVDFNPAAPANTNGWNLGETTANDTAASTKKGGRKFDPKKGGAISIESPFNDGRILSVALSAWGNGINTGNTSKLEIFGRASENDEYQLLFSRMTLSNKAAENEKADKVSIASEVNCHQIKISYTKDMGSWVLSTVTITDDTIRAETPTDVRIISADAEKKSATVTWGLADGLTTSEYRTFTTTVSGGFAEIDALWRETFNGIPAVKSTSAKLTDAKMSEFGLTNWEHQIVYQTKNVGAIVIGWEAKTGGILQEGFLMTPAFNRAFAEGCKLIVRAKKEDTKNGGNLPIYKISGDATNLIQEVAITSSLDDYVIPLTNALAATDKLLFHSSTVADVTNRKTLIDDIAICEAGAFKPETISTNVSSEIQTITTNAVSLVVPGGNTNLYFQVRTTYDKQESEWSEPILVSLSSDGADDSKTDEGDAGDGTSGGGTTGGETKIAAPTGVRAGLLPDGKIRIGWETPDAATNVTLRIWTQTKTGGLAALKDDDILWRETFANAPATNSNIKIDSEKKFNLYTDKGADAWDIPNCNRVYLAPDASAIRIGATKASPGALTTTPLGIPGTDDLMLVVNVRHDLDAKDSSVLLNAAILASGSTTNALGRTTLSSSFAEYAFSVGEALNSTDSLLIYSEIGSPQDGRIILDDIALVRNYTDVIVSTNNATTFNLGEVEDEHDLAIDTNVVHYVSLCAQDKTGETSEWTTPLAIGVEPLDIWQDHHLTLDRHGKASATLDIAEIYDAKKTKLDVADEPFRFLIDDAERLEITNNKNVTKITAGGIYVCTNVFERDWIALVPLSPETKSDVKEAEMRVAIETEAFAAQKISITGTFAQLDTKNNVERALFFQWRWITKEGEETDWIDFGSHATQYAASDTSPDLEATIETVTAEATLRLPDERTRAPAGARVEVRIVNLRSEGQKEAPLGFRDFSVRAESANRAIIFFLR